MKNQQSGSGSAHVAEHPGARSERVVSQTSRKADIDRDEMMKLMEAAGTPGPAHRTLEPLVGNWKAEVKCWMDPDGPPNVSHGTAKTKWVLNGHFLQEEFSGEMMGKPFTGISLMGYDNTKQKFNTIWISDMQTSIFVSEGKGESGNRVITLEGKSTCPTADRKNVLVKSVFRLLSPDKHVFEMFDEDKGMKTMEITYTRQ